jgi:nucleoid-associated protein YgaU
MNPRSDASINAAAEQVDGASINRRGKRATAAVLTTVGAALVGATLAAPAAEAKSPNAVWDRVASCESGQNWHINTGNGFYGGLQFSASTWTGYHGGKYASRADRATRLEQIEVARRVLASQGPGAWPVCGPRAGLSRSTGHATHAALPREAGRTVAAHKHHAKKHATKKHAVKHATRHRKGHHKHYTVRSGDTLSKIASRFHVLGGWHTLFKLNHRHLSNPNVLRVGQVLTLP